MPKKKVNTLGKREPEILEQPAPSQKVQPRSPVASITSSTSLRILLVAGVLSLLMHEPLYHDQAKQAYQEYIVEPLKRREQERQRQLVLEEQARILADLNVDQRTKLDRHKKLIEEEKKRRSPLVMARKAGAEKFKTNILKNIDTLTYKSIFFPIEYYDFGTTDQERSNAEDFFHMKSEELEVSPESPTQKDLQDMVQSFMPPNSYNVLQTSSTVSLDQHLGSKSQNCVARSRLMVMAVATKYPHLKDNLYIQQFGDHRRTLLKIATETYILEGQVERFPDAKTEKYRSAVFPFKTRLKLYAGVSLEKVKDDIFYYGPEKSHTKEYSRVTNDTIGIPIGGLDNIGTAESWFAPNSEGTHSPQHPTIFDPPSDISPPSPHNPEPPTDPQLAKKLEDQEPSKKVMKPVPQKREVQQQMNVHKLYEKEYSAQEMMNMLTSLKQTNANIQIIRFINLEKLSLEAAKVFMTQMPPNVSNISFRLLKTLTPETARILAEGKPESSRFVYFEFKNLELTPEIAASFQKNTRAGFTFYTEFLSEPIAAALAGEPAAQPFSPSDLIITESADATWDIDLEFIKEATPRVVEDPLRADFTFSGLKGLSSAAAQSLARINSRNLNFRDTYIGKAATEALAHARSGISYGNPQAEFIEGITSLKGKLTLNRNITPEAYDVASEIFKPLSMFKGKVLRIQNSHLFTPESLLEFNKVPGLLEYSFHMSDSLYNEIVTRANSYEDGYPHINILEAISQRKGPLHFELSFSPPQNTQDTERFHTGLHFVAKSLAAHKGKLTIRSNSLPPSELFPELLKHDGPLELKDYQMVLTKELASTLAQFKHALTLTITDASDDEIAALAKIQAPLFLPAFKPKSKFQARILGNRAFKTEVDETKMYYLTVPSTRHSLPNRYTRKEK